MRIRAKFTKLGYLRLLGHLDLMKLLQRAAKRSGVHLVYSQGFNPTPRLSIGNPLPLGVSSQAEYLEIETVESWEPAELLEQINLQLPEGIQLLDAVPVSGAQPKMQFSEYEIRIPQELLTLQEAMKSAAELLHCDHFEILREKRNKKTKRKEQIPIDIRPLLYQLRVEQVEDFVVLRFIGASGEAGNLRCDMLLQAFAKLLGRCIPVEGVYFHRSGQYDQILI
ncbi:MAG: TIGR03936 family radical SAM-associated protein [Tissierellia bacterium]|nr:TIGR03936 family radical SAM-associated protein [Tissierellia bacterium]